MVRTTSACLAALAALLATQGSAQDLCATASCIANGATDCNRATATCPPCMYSLSSGYSCYDLASGKCPFDDVLITCPPKAAPTPAPTPSPTVKPATVPPTTAPDTESPATVVPPQIDTPPATAAVSSATSPPATTTPKSTSTSSSDAGQATGATRPNSIQSNPTSSSSTISSSRSSDTTTSTPPSTPNSKASTSTPTPTPSTQLMDTTNKFASKKSSSLYVNIGVIVAAVAGVAIVAMFVVRRMKKRNDHGFLTTPEDGQKQFNLQGDRRSPPATGLHGGAGAGAAGAGAGFAPGTRGMSGPPAPRGRRGSSISSMGSDAPSLDSMNSSTIEFANKHPPYGLPSQFGLPSEANPYARSTTASTASSAANSAVSGGAFAQATRAPPPRPQAIQEGDEFTLLSKRKQSIGVAVGATRSERKQSAGATGLERQQSARSTNAVTPGGKSTARPVHKPVYHESVRHEPSLVLAAPGRSYEEEYDIVHPRALRDADRRNTETLVRDGRFQSNFSERDVRAVREDRFFATKELEL